MLAYCTKSSQHRLPRNCLMPLALARREDCEVRSDDHRWMPRLRACVCHLRALFLAGRVRFVRARRRRRLYCRREVFIKVVCLYLLCAVLHDCRFDLALAIWNQFGLLRWGQGACAQASMQSHDTFFELHCRINDKLLSHAPKWKTP